MALSCLSIFMLGANNWFLSISSLNLEFLCLCCDEGEDRLDSKHHNSPIYLSQWLLPSLNLSDKFIVTDVRTHFVLLVVAC